MPLISNQKETLILSTLISIQSNTKIPSSRIPNGMKFINELISCKMTLNYTFCTTRDVRRTNFGRNKTFFFVAFFDLNKFSMN